MLRDTAVAVRPLRSCLLVVLAFLVAPRAWAEPPEHALLHPHRAHRLWLRGIGYMGKMAGDRVLTVAPRFGGAFLLADKVDLDIEVPLVFTNVDVDDTGDVETRVAAANPFVGAAYVAKAQAHRFSLGLGTALPVAHDKASDAYDHVAFAYARALRGGREGWLYTPDRLAIVASATFETKIEHGPEIGLDTALALMPRVRGEGSSFVSSTQLGLSVAAVLAESVRLGGRFDSVLLPSSEAQRLQNALVPFLRVSTDDGVMFALELTVNIDEPYGFAFNRGGLWGLSIMAGSRF